MDMTVEMLIKRLSSLPQKAEVKRVSLSDIDTDNPYVPFTDKNIQFDGPNVVIY
jgi:hypothetical protein